MDKIVKSKPKTIKIGHGYYKLDMLRELLNCLPEGKVILTSYPGIPATNSYHTYSGDDERPKLECKYQRGHFTLIATDLPYYVADNGKAKLSHCLTYRQDGNLPAMIFSLLSVELPLDLSKLKRPTKIVKPHKPTPPTYHAEKYMPAYYNCYEEEAIELLVDGKPIANINGDYKHGMIKNALKPYTTKARIGKQIINLGVGEADRVKA